jgi:hypothetical protein
VELESKVIATTFALAAFVLALVCGLGAGNPASTVLLKAILCMVVCQGIGSIAGMMATHAIEEHLAKYRKDHPIPELSTGSQPYDEDFDEISANRLEKSP